MAARTESYYDGFRTFSWLGDIVGLPIDQVNFLLTQFSALLLAGALRKFLNASRVGPSVRHVFGLVMGLSLGYFCFGRQAMHLVGLPTICYAVMRTQPARSAQRVVLATALIYLSCVHYHRQRYNYGSYTLDITGPLMVITQKVTSLAFSIHDGLARDEKELTPTQRHQAVKQMPTALEYYSYVFHFQALMAGPVIFYRDYMDFINGESLWDKKAIANNEADLKEGSKTVRQPSPRVEVFKKVLISLFCAGAFVTLNPIFPIWRIKEEGFLSDTTMVYKVWYLMIVTMLARFKYYHAWIFADAICNNSGLGYNGTGEDGEPKWDFVSNVDAYRFEMSLSLKESIENWNKGTNRWLRSVVYERVRRQQLICTYALSAIWHGFYPGYYLTFASGAMFTVAARTVRRTVRPLFLGSAQKKLFYDVLTFLATRIVMAYTTFSFVLLEFVPSIRVYLHLYLLPHLLALAAIFLLPRLPLKPAKPERTSSEISNGSARKTM